MLDLTNSTNKKAIESNLDFFDGISLFNALSEEDIEAILKNSELKSYSKGTVLFFSSDPAKYFYIILSGWVKLFRTTLDGEEAIIDILTSKHILGETSIFEDDCYSYSAEIIEDAKIFQISISDLKKQIEQNNKLAFNMLSSMSKHRKQQSKEIEHLTLQNAPQRIGCFLLRLCDPSEKDLITLHLPYDKTLIASRLGMKAETFSRALTKLKEKTNISINGATIIIPSLEELSGYSCSACSNEYPCHDL